jgi:eukaryotic-like serine/threonine-protein kinase
VRGLALVTEPRFEGCDIVEKLRTGPATDWYLARQVSLRRSVVVKSLGSHLLPDSPFAAPLEREALLLARLHHENIVQLYDFKRQAERMWLVLEFVDGWSLEDLLGEVKKLTVPAALAVARELAVALQYVHQNGLVHRDVRPRNVIVSRRGEVKLSNFYLAAEDGAPAAPELLEGSSGFPDLSYMSPEQILGEHTDARSDLFALGVVLYEMISGRRPFQAGDNRTTAQRIRHEPPAPLGTDVGVLTPSIERILQRALAKHASDRFADAGEMLLLLDKALAEYDTTAKDALLHGLAEAAVIDRRSPRVPALPTRASGNPIWLSLVVYALSLIAFVAGSFAIHLAFPNRDRVRAADTPELSLTPKGAAHLRAVVRPWAHVFVDGQKVETTPFSEPIPLSPGVHYIRFEHPNSDPVPRRVELLPGQNLLLEVEMPLPKPVRDPDEELMKPPPLGPDGGRSP